MYLELFYPETDELEKPKVKVTNKKAIFDSTEAAEFIIPGGRIRQQDKFNILWKGG